MKTKGYIKKICITLLSGALLLSLSTGCAAMKEEPASGSVGGGKIEIVATLFPQFDFARQIAGDKAKVTLLLPPGVESHSYEPTPSDVVKINQADLFLYTGEHMEIWSQKIVDGMDSNCSVVDLSEGIELIHEGDPHFWTDPVIAKKMVNQITDEICRIDPVNEDYYRSNALNYNKQLDQLDQEFREIVKEGVRKKLLFGSRFALSYFAEEYGLSYEAAFDSCSSETEPSAKTIAHLIQEIEREKIPVVYYGEIEQPKVAQSISRETGAKMLLFHSCHNVTKEELEQGATYLTLMRQNADNLKEGLN